MRSLLRRSTAAVVCLAAMAVCASAQTTAPASGPSLGERTPSSAPASVPAGAAACLDWALGALGPLEQAVAEMEPMRWLADKSGVEAALADRAGAIGGFVSRLDSEAQAALKLLAEKPSHDANVRIAAIGSAWQLRRCQGELLLGQLHLHAAAAAPSEALRDQWLHQAKSQLRTLRVDYRQFPLSMMGFIYESQACRIAGDANGALEALEPLLKTVPAPFDHPGTELHRLAWVEKLQAQLLVDARKAVADANAARTAPEFRDQPPWQARLDWVVVQGLLAQMQAAKPPAGDAQTVQKCAALLRGEVLVRDVDAFERLKSLAELNAISPGLMTGAELGQWAQAQSASGLASAADTYAVIKASGHAALTLEQWLGYATALWKQNKWVEAATACDEALAASGDDPRRAATVQLRAAALTKALAQAGKEAPAALRTRLAGAMKDVVASSLAIDVRSDALCRWTAMQDLAADSATVLAALEAQGPLVEKNAYLLYVQGYCRYQSALNRLGADGDANALRDAAAAAAAHLHAAVSAGGQDPLAAKAALLEAQVLSGPILRDARGALQRLSEQKAALAAEASTKAPAAYLRVQLMTDLGMIDAAAAELVSVGGDGSTGQAQTPLRLAEALAQRYDGSDAAAAANIRKQVLDLASRGLSLAVGDKAHYSAAALRCVEAMLTVHADADALRIAAELAASAQDAELQLQCSILQARALHQQGKLSEAMNLLTDITAAHPSHLGALLLKGRCQVALRQRDKAADTFRQARKISKPGGPDWCLATLELADTLAAQGNVEGAGDILRVSYALHPDFGTPTLRARLLGMQEQWARTATTQPKGKTS